MIKKVLVFTASGIVLIISLMMIAFYQPDIPFPAESPASGTPR